MRCYWHPDRRSVLSMQISDYDYIHRVQYYETDAMGISHHSNYIRWAEEARCHFLYATGFDWKDVAQRTGIMIPVLAQSVEHKKAFAFGDIVRIQTKLIRFNGVKMDFEYAFYSAEGVLYAYASTKHGFVDRDFRPVMLQNALEREYSNIMSYISKQV